MAMGIVIGAESEGGERVGVAEDYFNVLPEGCIANIVSLTTPRDACRLCLVSTIFRSAAESDAVWERFLPPEYLSFVPSPPYRSKKDLYLFLCESPVLIDQGTKSFSLDKGSGKKCYMLSARSLSIVWGDTPRYWRWIPFPEARFEDVAELIAVCWFDVRGKIDVKMLSPSTLYSVNLVFRSVGAYGFQYRPVDASVGLVGGEAQLREVYLDRNIDQRPNNQFTGWRFGLQLRNLTLESQARGLRETEDGPHQPKARKDAWFEVELGEFFCDGVDGELEMSITEVHSGHWKGGLIFQGIEIRPKKV